LFRALNGQVQLVRWVFRAVGSVNCGLCR